MSKNIYPSNATWITPRSEETQITSDNCVILLPKKIDHVDKVYINSSLIPMWAHYYPTGATDPKRWDGYLSDIYIGDNSATAQRIGDTFDITRFIVEKNEYETLNIISGRDPTDELRHGASVSARA